MFRRKGRGMTNLTGEKLSVNQLIEAVGRASKETGAEAPHFKAEPDGENSRYVFKVEFETSRRIRNRPAFLRSSTTRFPISTSSGKASAAAAASGTRSCRS